MARTLYSVTMSLDGFIAGAGGDMQWLTPYLGDEDPRLATLVQEIGALLVGYRTHTGDDPNAGTDAEGAFGGQWDGPAVVLARDLASLPAPGPGVTVVDDVHEALALARAAAGHRPYVNILGAATARRVLEAGALDEVLVLVAPVLLGDGTRLFDHPGGTTVRLERLQDWSTPHANGLWFRVLPRS
jgi:dihydrofolate reductase